MSEEKIKKFLSFHAASNLTKFGSGKSVYSFVKRIKVKIGTQKNEKISQWWIFTSHENREKSDASKMKRE